MSSNPIGSRHSVAVLSFNKELFYSNNSMYKNITKFSSKNKNDMLQRTCKSITTFINCVPFTIRKKLHEISKLRKLLSRIINIELFRVSFDSKNKESC